MGKHHQHQRKRARRVIRWLIPDLARSAGRRILFLLLRAAQVEAEGCDELEQWSHFRDSPAR